MIVYFWTDPKYSTPEVGEQSYPGWATLALTIERPSLYADHKVRSSVLSQVQLLSLSQRRGATMSANPLTPL